MLQQESTTIDSIQADSPVLLDSVADLAIGKKLDGPIQVDKAKLIQSMDKQSQSGWFKRWISTHFGPGKLSLDEYLYYGLHNPDLSSKAINRFVGKNIQNKMHWKCNDPAWFAIAHNKFILHSLLSANGIAHPKLQLAAMHNGMQSTGTVTNLDENSLNEFLSNKAVYPLFAKPIEGMYSIGAMRIDGYNNGIVNTARFGQIPLEIFLNYISTVDDKGYLFQELLTPAADWSSQFGINLPSIRLTTICEDDSPSIHMATIKIPNGAYDADNFWRDGNLLAPVDLKTGMLGKAVITTPEGAHQIDDHPVSNKPISGYAITEWEDACNLVLRAASLSPGIKTQGWDIALTDKGPIALELNFGGDLNLHQLAHQRGVLDNRLIMHLKRCNYRGKLPRIF